MKIDLGTKMVRLRVARYEAEDDARILAERKARREKLLDEARKDQRLPGFVFTWFRGRCIEGRL